jgi:hypothetical protein
MKIPQIARLFTFQAKSWYLDSTSRSRKGSGGIGECVENLSCMPDLGSMLLRSSLEALESGGRRCGRCERTPLPGERLHEIDSGRVLCELCFLDLPEDHRIAVRVERVRVGDGRLAIVSKAA